MLRHYDLMRTKIARLATRGDFKWITTDEIDDERSATEEGPLN